MKDGKIDAFFWSGGLPTAAVQDLSHSPGISVRLVPTGDLVSTLQRDHGDLYFPLTIPAGTYPGGTETVTILELARQVQEQMGISMPLRASFLPYEALPGKYQDVRHRVPDTTKAQELLGFAAQIGVNEGLERTIAWHQSRRAGEGIAARA